MLFLKILVPLCLAITALVCEWQSVLIISVLSFAIMYYLTLRFVQDINQLISSGNLTLPSSHWIETPTHYLLNKIWPNLNLFPNTIPFQLLSTVDICSRRISNKRIIEEEIKVYSRLICEYYIKFWFKEICPNNDGFLFETERLLNEMFVNFFKRCKKLNTDRLMKKIFIALDQHVQSINDEVPNSTDNNIEGEEALVYFLIERFLKLCGPPEVQMVMHLDEFKHPSSMFIMIREMLLRAVVIPIATKLSEPDWLLSNIIRLCDVPCESDEVDVAAKINKQLSSFDTNSNSFSTALSTRESNDFEVDKRMSLSLPDFTKITSNFSLNLKSVSENELYCKSHFIDLVSNIDSKRSSLRNSRSDSLDTQSIDIEEGDEVNCKLFVDIVITNTEEVRSHGTSYLLYCIEYSALYEEANRSADLFPITTSCFEYKKSSVKRRFREFITLEERLKEKKSFRSYLSRITSPAKLKSATQNFMLMTKFFQKEAVERRKVFLEQYLNYLNENKGIAESKEFQQFLAYGSDGRIAFVKSKPNTLLPVPINEVISKGFKGVVSFVKSALPDSLQLGQIDLEGNFINYNTERISVRSIKTKPCKESQLQLDKKLDKWERSPSRLRIREEHLINVISKEGTSFSEANTHTMGPRLQGDADAEFRKGIADTSQCNQKSIFEKEIPLTALFLNISSKIIQNVSLTNSSLVYVLKIIAGKFSERLVVKPS